jgi:hypothetical protein
MSENVLRPRCVRAVHLWLSPLLVVTSFASTAHAASECLRLPLKLAQPQWISSAAYLGSMDKIAVVDPLRNQLLLISPKGDSIPYGERELGVPEKEMVPAIVNPTEVGFDLAMVDRRVYSFDHDLKPLKVEDWAKASTGPRGTILGVYDSVLSGDHFFSVGAVKANTGKLRLGFFRGSKADPAGFQFLRDIPAPDYYILGHQYLATMNGNDYAVLMTEHPVILEFSRKGRTRILDVIPARPFKAVKLKTEATGPSSDEPMYKEIEGLAIPVGIYAQDGLLYLLTREPTRESGTLWRLFQIDPNKGKVVGRPMVLPTTAHHLTIVESAEDWYVFEKGAVQPAGNQEIPTVLAIPSANIRSRSVPDACQSHP